MLKITFDADLMFVILYFQPPLVLNDVFFSVHNFQVSNIKEMMNLSPQDEVAAAAVFCHFRVSIH